MRQRAAASLLYQSKYAEAAFRNLLKLIFLKIVGRILAFYTYVTSRVNLWTLCDTVIHRVTYSFAPLLQQELRTVSFPSDRLFFFLGGYLPPDLRGDPGNGSPRPAEDKLLTHLCNQTSKVALSISFRGRNGGTEV